MATATYLEQSFLAPFWQHVIDVNAALIPVPLGTVSGSLSGFAFENVGGTYTVFLGTDIVLGASGPIRGTVTQIVRRSNLKNRPGQSTPSSPARIRPPISMRRFWAAGRRCLAASSPATTPSISSSCEASARSRKAR